ncbi:MAG: class I SAM-dependent methyltransferase [Nitrososphaerota archaeon]
MSELDRTTWLRQRRLWNEVQMDTIYARQYDEHWGSYINDTHRRMLSTFLDACPPHARILDAACGTGKYWPLLLERDCSIVGTDQSAQMLARAQAKHPDVTTHHVGLQELDFADAFDGVICMDAMENVFPEDWPLVLGRFRRALRAGGHLYVTVEMQSDEELRIAYDAGQHLGLPLIFGEYAHHGGYHYYPTDEQVRAWLAGAGFALDETAEGDEYRHYLARTSASQ